MKICKSCGNENDNDSLFCEKCGANFREEANLVTNSVSKKEVSNETIKIVIKFILLALVGLLFFVFFKYGEGKEIKKAKNTKMDILELGYSDINMTYGEFFKKACRKQKWENFTSSDYDDVVELKGVTKGGEKIVVQFRNLYETMETRDYIIWYSSLDGRSMDTYEFLSYLLYNYVYDD